MHGDLALSKFSEPISLKLIKVRAEDVGDLQSQRPDFRRCVEYYKDKIRSGTSIDPILVHFSPSGKYEILDGFARATAYRGMGITEFPAVENGLLNSIRSGASKVAHKAGRLLSRVPRKVPSLVQLVHGRHSEV